MKNPATGFVLYDITSAAPDTGVIDVSEFRYVRIDVKVLTATGGAVNNVAVFAVDTAMGDPAAVYASGTPTGYTKGAAGTFFSVMFGPGIPNGTLGNGGTALGVATKPEFLRALLMNADNTTAFTARMRVIGFF